MKLQNHMFVGTTEIPNFQSSPPNCLLISASKIVLPIQELYNNQSEYIKQLDSEHLVVFVGENPVDNDSFNNHYTFLNKRFILTRLKDSGFDINAFNNILNDTFRRLQYRLNARYQFNDAIRSMQLKCRQIQSNSNASLTQVLNDCNIFSNVDPITTKNIIYLDSTFPRNAIVNTKLQTILSTCASQHGQFTTQLFGANVCIYWANSSSYIRILQLIKQRETEQKTNIIIFEHEITSTLVTMPNFDQATQDGYQVVPYIKWTSQDMNENQVYNQEFIINSILDALDILQDQPLYLLNNYHLSLRDGNDDLSKVFDRVKQAYATFA